MPEQQATALGLAFSLELDLVDEVAHDAERTDALITVRAGGSARAAADAGTFAEIIVMDSSLSMAYHGKMTAAKRAACAAIDALDDGVYLGVIAGSHESRVVFPADGRLARVDAGVRASAKERVFGIMPEGGTAIGRWLTRAADLFEASSPSGAVCHAALYTDGRDEHETPEQLRSALDRCADRFVCDPRGLGDDWDYAQLLSIAEALHGEAKAVVEVADLTADFVRLTEHARRLVVPRVYLGLRLDSRFRVGFVRQVRPVEAVLAHQPQGDDKDVLVPLGAWSAESRQYRLALTFDPEALAVDEEVRAARVCLLADTADGAREACADSAPLVVSRSELGAPPPPLIESLTWAANAYDLGTAMRGCADAYLAEDFARADGELERALQFAEILGDEDRLRLLRSVANLGGGQVRVIRGLRQGLIQQLGVDSTRTGVLVPEAAGSQEDGSGEPEQVRVCAKCGEATYGDDALVCENCRTPFPGEAS